MSEKNEFKDWIRNSITFKSIVIGFLILVLLIPAGMIKELINERSSLRESVVAEINSKWGYPQTIYGPILSIPFKKYYKSENKIVEEINYAHFLPVNLFIEGELVPEIRNRGIYEVVVYNSKLNFSGDFLKPDFNEWKINKEDVLWEDASISIGIPDMRGIKEAPVITWNKTDYNVNPGIDYLGYNGISSKVNINESSQYLFSFNLNLNGSDAISFIPVGKETNVEIKSIWKNPSFEGSFLPNERTINERGFNAKWKVLHLNRSFPQKWINKEYSTDAAAFGVNLLLPVDHYQKSLRSAKYAIMFIALTFMVFFFTEILNKKRMHPIQYLLVGLGLSIFYSLLVSLSEQINFNVAYFIASVAIIVLITGYSYSILKNFKLTAIVAIVLFSLYSFLYTILQLQDYSLLIGSIGLFVTLAIIMYLSRKVNWYNSLEE
jgi:inner membrane protein